ncbi:MAG: membrane protein insertase YidC, partial [Betaproteobacteria bacterium]|nr:membrane protein insertase YidC [Betaproteobacteria bacterium]
MDIQRLIAFVVFSFSALLLWDAWQKHNAPKVPAQQAAVAGKPAGGTAPTPSVPLAPQGGASAPAAGPGAPAAAPVEATGQPVTVKTDLFEVELNTAGGD